MTIITKTRYAIIILIFIALGCFVTFGLLTCIDANASTDLRAYEVKSINGYWMAQDPASYITPNNDIIKEYASNFYIDLDKNMYREKGTILYTNEFTSYSKSMSGELTQWAPKHFDANYTTDLSQFKQSDYWVNPDYYLTHENTGDCEDLAIATTSMMLSGKMYIKKGGLFNKEIIPAKVILGYSDKGNRHAWTEYNVHNDRYIIDQLKYIKPDGDLSYVMSFIPEKEWKYTPIWEFDNKGFRDYQNR